MKTLHSLEELAALPGPLHLAIGVFDGLHLGHLEVIQSASNAAAAEGGHAVVTTFDPHPIRVLRPELAPRMLTNTRHKEIVLERLGLEYLLEIPFNTAFAALSAAEFVHRLIQSAKPLGSISVGETWAFGKGREGNLTTLKRLGENLGFQVHGIKPVSLNGEVVSSTRIRLAVEAGNFELAAKLLGRKYAVLGTIVQGRQIGRKIGFPTANFATQSEQLPPMGVYAVKVINVATGVSHPAVANLGMRPTVESGPPSIVLEAHLFDFEGDLYGKEMKLQFVARIRDEIRLPNLDALKAQIALDCKMARSILGMEQQSVESIEEAVE